VGDFAYVVGGQGMRIIDVSDPANPVERGSFSTGTVSEMDLSGELVYLAGGNFGFQIVRAVELSNVFLPIVIK
jgi:hypothetical protein